MHQPNKIGRWISHLEIFLALTIFIRSCSNHRKISVLIANLHSPVFSSALLLAATAFEYAGWQN